MELLRIISMVLIVAHHYAVHGGFEWASSDMSLSRFWFNFLVMGGRGGVNLFVLISGYYLIDNKSMSLSPKRIIRFWGEVFFYSVSIFLVFSLCLGRTEFSIRSLISSLFPVTLETWWFASTYFVLYLLHPFLNQLLSHLERSVYQRGLLLFFILWCIVPTISGKHFQCNNLLWFVYLYSIAAYLKIYGDRLKVSTRFSLVFLTAALALSYSTSIILMYLGTRSQFFAQRTPTHFFDMDMLPTLIWSVAMFVFFISLKPSHNRFINGIASCTFGVYLLHENMYTIPFLWNDLFDNVSKQGHVSIIPHSIFAVLLVYAACTFVDYLRKVIVERLVEKKVPMPSLFRR